MQMIDETKNENWGGAGFLACAFLGLTVIWATGCAGGKVFVGYERTDAIQETRSTIDKPLSCIFTNCKEGK